MSREENSLLKKKPFTIFTEELCAKPPEKKTVSYKTTIFFVDETASINFSDLKEFGAINNKTHIFCS